MEQTTKVTVNAPAGTSPEALGRAAAEALKWRERVDSAHANDEPPGSYLRLAALVALLSAQVAISAVALLISLIQP